MKWVKEKVPVIKGCKLSESARKVFSLFSLRSSSDLKQDRFSIYTQHTQLFILAHYTLTLIYILIYTCVIMQTCVCFWRVYHSPSHTLSALYHHYYLLHTLSYWRVFWGVRSLLTLIHWFTDSLIIWITDSLIHWFSDSLILWFTDSLIHWFSDSLIIWITDSLTHWFTDSLIHWFSHSFIHWFSDSLILWFIDSLILWFYESLIIWFIDSLIHWVSDSLSLWFTESLIHWFSDSMNHWFSDSLIHWVSDSLILWIADSLIHWFTESLILWHTHTHTHTPVPPTGKTKIRHCILIQLMNISFGVCLPWAHVSASRPRQIMEINHIIQSCIIIYSVRSEI